MFRRHRSQVRRVEADMTAFRLAERFDVVLCVYDSINHLLEYAQWEAVFDHAHEHLNEGGVLVFDINTEERLVELSARPALVHWFGAGNLLVLDVARADTFVWNINVFEHEGDGSYRLHEEAIDEVSFPRDRIEASLRERFRRVSTHERGDRLYLVAAR